VNRGTGHYPLTRGCQHELCLSIGGNDAAHWLWVAVLLCVRRGQIVTELAYQKADTSASRTTRDGEVVTPVAQYNSPSCTQGTGRAQERTQRYAGDTGRGRRQWQEVRNWRSATGSSRPARRRSRSKDIVAPFKRVP